jgi:hypothetical protein
MAPVDTADNFDLDIEPDIFDPLRAGHSDAPLQVPSSWQLLDDVELMALPDPQWIIQSVIAENSVGVIYSPPGIGKTTFVASMATAIATGKDWFGRQVTLPGSCVYGAAEDAPGFKIRLRAAKRAAHLPLNVRIGVYTFPEAIDLRDPISVTRFLRFLQGQEWPAPLRVVVIDTYAASMPGAAENSSEDVTTAMVHAQKLRKELGVTVILVHHTNASGSRERGHSAMRGAADFMLAMNPSDDVVSVEASKQRNGVSGEEVFKLKLVPLPDGDGCVFRLASDVLSTAKMTPAQAKIYAVLRDSFSADGATKTEWQRCCTDVADRTFYHAATKLAEHGYVKAVGTHFRITGQGSK